MKRLLLLAVLLIFVATLFNVTTIYAATEYSQTSDNYINTSLVHGNITNNTQKSNLTIQNSTGPVKENAAVPVSNATFTTLKLIKNTSNSSKNSEININSSNITDVQNSTDAAGDELYKNVRGIWLKAEDVDKLDINKIKKAGITDIFVKTNILTNPSYQSVLKTILNNLKDTGINVHAWITCFKDANGNWIDPQGTQYNYTVKVPDKKIKYTTKTKVWYKYKGKWKYKWKYVTNYKYTYKDETRTGYDTSKIDSLITSISNIVKNYNIDGINLDYVRYHGDAYKYANGTAAVTSFVQKVYNTVKSIKPKVAVSADVMPEGSMNAYYYGQNYTQLAKYLDFIVPMVYKGNYGYNNSNGTNSKGKSGNNWIGSAVSYIVSHSGGTPVLAGLQTYRCDNNLTIIPSNELQKDINSAIDNGASGYVLFRYGLISSNFYKNQSTNPITFTLDQIKSAAVSIKSFIDTNHRLPNYVTINKNQVAMPDLLRLMTSGILQLNSGTKTPVSFKSVKSPLDSTGDLINGTIKKSEYLSIAQKIKSYIDSNGIGPNYVTSSLGKIQYESTIYMCSNVLSFYNTNKRLPNYVTVNPWMVNSLPPNLQQYLKPTKNCQSDNPQIKSLASSLTKGMSSTYDKGVKIFNWVRDNIGYTFYNNTKYGAVGTLLNKTGNCVDTSHLMIALARSAGIPARYEHGTCTFTMSGHVWGHVWAQFYINGKWYNADGTSTKNSLGVIANWNTNTAIMEGNYAELPF